jgi:hypothetical protein
MEKPPLCQDRKKRKKYGKSPKTGKKPRARYQEEV